MYDIPLNPRMRKLCNSGQIADDFHNNILERKELLTFRHKFLEDKCC